MITQSPISIIRNKARAYFREHRELFPTASDMSLEEKCLFAVPDLVEKCGLTEDEMNYLKAHPEFVIEGVAEMVLNEVGGK